MPINILYPCPWARGFGNKGTTLWDDLGKVPDTQSLRNFVMAYPTRGGVVPNFQGEGFREAVDDIRHITTLENLLEKTKQAPSLNIMVKENEEWLNTLNPEAKSLQDIRWQIASRIIELQARVRASSPPNAPLSA